MLTSDLVRATRRQGRLLPRYLSAKDRERLLPIAEALIATYGSLVGGSRGELDEAAAAIPHGARDRAVVAGLRKLCDDRTELEQDSPLEPEAARWATFTTAAAAHRSSAGFAREAVLVEAAAKLGAPPDVLERSLFADLRDAQIVKSFQPVAPAELLAHYDVALLQAVLLRATQLVLTFKDSRPSAVRELFRAARFHGLLYVVERAPKGGWRMTLDGPFSLFDSVQKYGLRLGLFLTTALTLQSFELSGTVLWGPEKTPLEIGLSASDGLAAPRGSRAYERPEVSALKSAFEALRSPWEVSDNDHVVVARDGVAFVPDLSFCSRQTGEQVFLEVFGFWSRAAVWRRVEQIRAGLPARLVLAVSKGARVSEEVLDEAEGGSCLYVFRSAISAKEVLRRLDAAGTNNVSPRRDPP